MTPFLCSALCQGDSGGGLVFKAQDRVVERYYLRGIVSTAPESQEACNVFARTSFTKITKHKQFIEKNIEAVDQISANQQETIDEKLCILPPYPENGIYNTSGAPETRPGQSTHSVSLSVACNSGFKLDKDVRPSCANGIWTADIPKCIAVFCKLDPHPSVTYRCEVTNDGISSYFRECNKQEPAGTIVWPQCNEPNYHSTGTLASMRCFNEGLWTYIAICQPECGRVIPESSLLDSNQTRPRDQLNTDGRVATRGELPWHAGVYRKTTNPYMQICGGSLVSTNAVISAAHCFWSDVEKQLPASNYAIAVGKLYRPWNDLRDPGAQKSDVKDILIPTRYQGAATNFQDNIAIVLLTRTIEYSTHVRPVCLDFDISFERRQLQGGRLGKVAGWGLKGVDGEASPVLKVVDLPYVDIAECITDSPPGFREYITSDKICVGYRNGTALCKGDSGGGLVFPAESERGTERYYLRGVVSSAPACYTFPIAATQLLKHESFVKDYLSSIFY
ncbi:trypsin domain-containing protein [Phthorimaea operculella]|nr:trypsin domain-containing protein [Phthorimaea operculella]